MFFLDEVSNVGFGYQNIKPFFIPFFTFPESWTSQISKMKLFNNLPSRSPPSDEKQDYKLWKNKNWMIGYQDNKHGNCTLHWLRDIYNNGIIELTTEPNISRSYSRYQTNKISLTKPKPPKILLSTNVGKKFQKQTQTMFGPQRTICVRINNASMNKLELMPKKPLIQWSYYFDPFGQKTSFDSPFLLENYRTSFQTSISSIPAEPINLQN